MNFRYNWLMTFENNVNTMTWFPKMKISLFLDEKCTRHRQTSAAIKNENQIFSKCRPRRRSCDELIEK